MPFQQKTLQDYVNEAFQYLLAAFPQLNTSPGTVLSGIISSFINAQYGLSIQLNNAINNAFVSTATGTALDAIANDYGLFRKSATFATGTLTLSTDTPATQTLTGPPGAKFSTVNNDLTKIITFTSTTSYTIPVGQTQASVTVVADLSGSQGNVGVGTVTNTMTPLQGIVTVTNGAGFSGGSDVESDESLRQRILLALVPVNTLAKVKAAVLAVVGCYMCAVTDDQDGKGSFHVYAGDQSGSLAAIQAAVTTAVSSNKSLGSVATIQAPTVTTVNINYNYAVQPGASSATVQAAINTAITNFFLNLQIGQVFRPFELSNAIAGANSQIYFVPGLLDFYVTSYSLAVPYVPAAYECVKLGVLTPTLVAN